MSRYTVGGLRQALAYLPEDYEVKLHSVNYDDQFPIEIVNEEGLINFLHRVEINRTCEYILLSGDFEYKTMDIIEDLEP